MPKLSNTMFDGLTGKQKVWVTEYVVDMNASRAAREAGYSNAELMGGRLTRNGKVMKAVDKLLAPRMAEADLSSKRLLKQLESFIFYDLMEYVDSEGNLKCKPKDLPDNIRQCITDFQVATKYSKDGDLLEVRHNVKLVSKMAALKMAMDYQQLLVQKVDVHHSGSVGFNWSAFYGKIDGETPETVEEEVLRLTLEE